MGLFSHNCDNDGHRTEARYDHVFPDFVSRLTKMSGYMEQLKVDIYVHDICVRCGTIFKRDAEIEKG